MSFGLLRGLALLRHVAEAAHPLTFTEINTALGTISKASLSRLLNVLRREGYLCRYPDGRYGCGDQMAHFAGVRRKAIRDYMIEQWGPLMKELSRRFDITFILLERVGNLLINIRREQTEFSMFMQKEGTLNDSPAEPWLLTLAAYEPAAAQEGSSSCRDEWPAIRRQGYYDEYGTVRPGIRRLAFPLTDRTGGDIIGILGMGGPVSQLTDTTVHACIEAIQAPQSGSLSGLNGPDQKTFEKELTL